MPPKALEHSLLHSANPFLPRVGKDGLWKREGHRSDQGREREDTVEVGRSQFRSVCMRAADIQMWSSAILEKWLNPNISPFMVRHHFWCFTFFIYKKIQNIMAKRTPICIPFSSAKTLCLLFFCFSSMNLSPVFSFQHLHIDKVYNILQLNKTER